jgi:hypothetical protein
MALWSAMVVLSFGVVGVVFLAGSCKSSELSESSDSRSVKSFLSVVYVCLGGVVAVVCVLG